VALTGNADEFVAGSIEMARRGVLATHRLGPVLVRLGTDRAVANLGGVRLGRSAALTVTEQSELMSEW